MSTTTADLQCTIAKVNTERATNLQQQTACAHVCAQLKSYQSALNDLSKANLSDAIRSANPTSMPALTALADGADGQRALIDEHVRQQSQMVRMPMKSYDDMFSAWQTTFRNLDNTIAEQKKSDAKLAKMRAKQSKGDLEAKIKADHMVGPTTSQMVRLNEDCQGVVNDLHKFSADSIHCFQPMANAQAQLLLNYAQSQRRQRSQSLATMRSSGQSPSLLTACDALNTNQENAAQEYNNVLRSYFDDIRALSIVNDD